MKKLINEPHRAVTEMLDGLLALYPGVARLDGTNVLIRADAPEVRERQVALISGGGSGHEPAHAGYLGAGMLSGAAAGEVFSSPSAKAVLAAIEATAGSLGALLIIKNYTGDRLNFGLAAEMARSKGILVESVVVADDVALQNSEQHAGRRGLAGTVLVHKVAGAAAAEGKDLPQVASIAQATADQIGTMGVALSAGTAPGAARSSFELKDQIELGLGIHGEPGVRKIDYRPVSELVEELLQNIVHGLRLRAGERIVALLNNLGATTPMELAIAARSTLAVLEGRGLTVERFYSGTFLSSLNMEGISLSLMRVDEERLRRLDAPTSAPAWANGPKTGPGDTDARIYVSGFEELKQDEPEILQPPRTEFGRKAADAVKAACDALVAAEERLTELDREVGDGDLGNNLARVANAILRNADRLPFDSPAKLMHALALLFQDELGGSSGPLYSALFLRTGTFLDPEQADAGRQWATAMSEGCGAVGELGGARLGDRTMLDALVPFAQAFSEGVEQGGSIFESAAAGLEAAQAGVERTASMVARKGRTSYLGKRSLGVADPGAAAVAIWLEAVVSSIAG
jgi:triose/dihydroxyacetone kinase / FAD-AMP lyase (cyclizing)